MALAPYQYTSYTFSSVKCQPIPVEEPLHDVRDRRSVYRG